MVGLISHEAKRDLQKLIDAGMICMDGDSHIIPLQEPYLDLLRLANGERIPYNAIYGVPVKPNEKDLEWAKKVADAL